MSLATEKKLISKNYYPLVNTTTEMTYVKKFDECTQYTIKKRGSKYVVKFTLEKWTNLADFLRAPNTSFII